MDYLNTLRTAWVIFEHGSEAVKKAWRKWLKEELEELFGHVKMISSLKRLRLHSSKR